MDIVRDAEDKDLSKLPLQIERYLSDLPASVLGIKEAGPIQILEMTHGTYNINYHVRIGGKDFIFRLNIDQQSGLANQIEYEFLAMKLLEKYEIAPKVYHLDDTCRYFEFGILIEEHLAGSHARLEDAAMPEVAQLLVRLHQARIDYPSMVAWEDPLQDNYQQICQDIREYEAKLSPDPKVVANAKQMLERIRPQVDRYASLFRPDGINHTDTAIDNFIETRHGLRLIDWEKPRMDDCTYDICCFLCEPAQLWCSPKPLSPNGREIFLNSYLQHSGKEEDLLREKIRIREPIVSLHWILWGANKLCDVRDRRTANGLLSVHELKVERWQRMSLASNIEKLLEAA